MPTEHTFTFLYKTTCETGISMLKIDYKDDGAAIMNN